MNREVSEFEAPDTDPDVMQAVENFEAEWKSGHGPPSIPFFLNTLPVEVREKSLPIILEIDFEFRIRRGLLASATMYFEEFPELQSNAAFLASLLRIESQWVDRAWPQIPAVSLRRLLGRGAAGSVYEAHDQNLHRMVAVKVMRRTGNIVETQRSTDQFLREARAIASLNHPNIVQIYAVSETPKQAWFIMELADKGSLATRLSRPGLKPGTAATWVEQLARAVHYAHSKGIVHCDIKPENIVMTLTTISHGDAPTRVGADECLLPKLTDFGLAKTFGKDPASISSNAYPEGSMGYMAPEQISGCPEPRSDIYSLGAVLHRILYGCCPETRFFTVQGLPDTVSATKQSQKGDEPELTVLSHGVSRDLETICRKCIEPIPEDRYPTAAALAEDLKRFINGENILARRPTLLQRVRSQISRHPRMAARLLLFSVSGLVLFFISIVGLIRHYENSVKESRIRDFVQTLPLTEISSVLTFINRYQDCVAEAEPLLRTSLERFDALSGEALRIRLALVRNNPNEHLHQLLRHLDGATLKEADIISEEVKPHADLAWAELSRLLNEQSSAQPLLLLPATVVLAAIAPGDAMLEGTADRTVQQLLNAEFGDMAAWSERLRPLRRSLIASLQKWVSVTSSGDAYEDSVAARKAMDLLIFFAGEQTDILCQLIPHSDRDAFTSIVDRLRLATNRAIDILRQEVTSPAVATENRPYATEKTYDGVILKQLQNWNGDLAPTHAACVTMPVRRLADTVKTLQSIGYQLKCLRPYTTDKEVLVAAVWKRCDFESTFAFASSPSELTALCEKHEAAGLVPIDIARYMIESKDGRKVEEYAGLWRVCSDHETGILRVGPQILSNELISTSPEAPLHYRHTLSQWADNEEVHACGIWQTFPELREPPSYATSLYEYDFEALPFRDLFQTDVRIESSFSPSSARTRYLADLMRLESELATSPEDAALRISLVNCCFRLNQDDRALKELETVLLHPEALSERNLADVYGYLALISARRGEKEKAYDAIEKRRKLMIAGTDAYIEPVVAFLLGDTENGVRNLKQSCALNQRDPSFCFLAARAYGVAASIAKAESPQRADEYSNLAVEMLDKALSNGWNRYREPESEQDLEVLHSVPAFRQTIESHRLGIHYHASWYPTAEMTSSEVHGLSPQDHALKSLHFALVGYEPASISAMQLAATGQIKVASVWHRKAMTAGQRESVTKGRATMLAALLELGDADLARIALRHNSDPDLRVHLIERISHLGLNPAILQGLLSDRSVESDVKAAILMALEPLRNNFPFLEDRERLIHQVLEIYRADGSPEVHSAAEWLLKRWNVQEDPAMKDQMKLSPSWFDQQDWAVSPDGLTFARIYGPTSFWLGTREKAEQSGANEFPVWKTIPRSVALSTNEVPHQLFEQFLMETKVNLDDQEARSRRTTGPAIQVTWLEAVQFCSWLNKREGIPVDQWCYPAWEELEQIKGTDRKLSLPADYLSRTGYRLPTETEWEFFCRAGTESGRYFGTSRSLMNSYVWYLENADELPRDAGTMKPNPLGMFGMLGSAWEWCDDVITDFDENKRRYAPIDNEHSVEISRDQNRILKGGGYLSLAHNLRSGRSHWGQANARDNSAGFRIARTLRPGSKESVH